MLYIRLDYWTKNTVGGSIIAVDKAKSGAVHHQKGRKRPSAAVKNSIRHHQSGKRWQGSLPPRAKHKALK